MAKIVPPTGPTDADIAIVGEAPGRTEVNEGEPFVGSAGRLLNRFLRMRGIPRDSVYLTNLSKIRPKGNNFKKRFFNNGKPTKEYYRFKDELMQELKDVDPNVIVPLGNNPLYALTGKSSITRWRGSILDSPVGKVIPTIHPSAVQRRWAYFPYVLFDFKRIKGDSKFPELRLPEFDLITEPSMEDVTSAFENLFNSDKVAFDIELTGKQIDMVSFCPSEDWSICVPFAKTINGSTVTNKHYWDSIQERHIWRLISDLLYDKSVGKMAQNANFDIAYMARYGCETRNLYLDTMNAHHLIYPELKKGMDTIQSIYTRIPYHKDQSNVDRQRYNALDSMSTFRTGEALDEELKDVGLYDFYHDMLKKAVQYYRVTSDIGVKIDQERRKGLESEYKEREDEIQEKINENCPWQLDDNYANTKLNPRSPKQLKKYFYDKRGYYVYKNKGKPTTNEEALNRLSRRYPDDPIPELVLKSRNVRKRLGTYIRAPIDPDLRMRCTYIVSGTKTGRLSSRSSINDTGTNLQNIPHGPVREMFVPTHEDWVFTEADLSGADAMVVAYESEDPGLINLFEQGADYHATNTFMIFDECEVPNPEHIEKYDVDQNLRKKSKSISHGANYGRSYKSIALELQTGEKRAKELLQTYKNSYPGIEQWHRRIERQLREEGTLETPLGRIRQFFGSFRRSRRGIPNHVLREAYAYVPQSVVGDLIHIGFVNLYERLQDKPDDYPARIVMNIHDSLIVEHSKDVQDEVEKMMKETMEIPIDIRGREVTIPIDFETANNWRDL